MGRGRWYCDTWYCAFRCIATQQHENYFLQNGADANASAVGGVTALHIAANHSDERMVDCLLAAGANPDAVDDVCNIFVTIMSMRAVCYIFLFCIAYFLYYLITPCRWCTQCTFVGNVIE